MNKSPNSLGEIIRIMNSNLSEVNITEYNHNYYVTESSIKSYMEDNNIHNINNMINAIIETNNIDKLSILNDSTMDSDLVFIKDIMMIYETLNPLEVVKVSRGRTLLKSYIDQAAAFIKKHEYNESDEVRRYIEKCDKMLANIAEEKELVIKKKNDSSALFSAMYIVNLAKNIFFIFFVPLMLSNSKIQWPVAITKLFLNNGKKEIIGKTVTSSKKIKKVANTLFIGIDAGLTLPSDIKGLYLSFKDYNKLLSEYETQIRNIRNGLVRQLAKLERSKEINSMVNFKEDCTNKDAVEVLYQSPEDLKVKDRTPEIVHDDQIKQMEAPTPETNPEIVPAVEPEIKKEIPTQKVEPAVVPPAEFTPIDAINQVKCDPCNVAIAKYGDKYYIDHKDLKCYMDACGESKYENALNKIINAHDDPELCAKSIRVIMGNNDLSCLDSKTKDEMEASNVQFEIYSIESKKNKDDRNLL